MNNFTNKGENKSIQRLKLNRKRRKKLELQSNRATTLNKLFKVKKPSNKVIIANKEIVHKEIKM